MTLTTGINTRRQTTSVVTALFISTFFLATTSPLFGQSSVFTFQGKLNNGGSPTTMSYDIGNSSGITNTTGNSNSFFGFEAGRQNLTGNNNSFFGNRAGGNNSFGASNTIVGGFAGRLNNTGNSNSFVGASAGFNNTSENSNLFVGASARILNSAGNNNTILGTNANLGSNNLNNSGAIGFGAFVTQSNSLVLGGVTGINSGSNTRASSKMDALCFYAFCGISSPSEKN